MITWLKTVLSVGGPQPGEKMMVLGSGWWWKMKRMDVREIYRVKTTDPGGRLLWVGWCKAWFAGMVLICLLVQHNHECFLFTQSDLVWAINYVARGGWCQEWSFESGLCSWKDGSLIAWEGENHDAVSHRVTAGSLEIKLHPSAGLMHWLLSGGPAEQSLHSSVGRGSTIHHLRVVLQAKWVPPGDSATVPGPPYHIRNVCWSPGHGTAPTTISKDHHTCPYSACWWWREGRWGQFLSEWGRVPR